MARPTARHVWAWHEHSFDGPGRHSPLAISTFVVRILEAWDHWHKACRQSHTQLSTTMDPRQSSCNGTSNQFKNINYQPGTGRYLQGYIWSKRNILGSVYLKSVEHTMIKRKKDCKHHNFMHICWLQVKTPEEMFHSSTLKLWSGTRAKMVSNDHALVTMKHGILYMEN